MNVLVLGGGPDPEREVSLESSAAVAAALDACKGMTAERRIIERPESIDDLPGEVIFPALHGAWGEGGPLQRILVRDGRPFVGCGPDAARLCMDKLATKLIALSQGVRTPHALVLTPGERVPPIPAPAVVKPVHDGSSVGLAICRTQKALREAVREPGASAFGGPRMIEAMIPGRELTCGLVDRGNGFEALPLVEIVPADGAYDYQAKYARDDTRYIPESEAAPGFDAPAIKRDTLRLAEVIGLRHLARADFMIDDSGDHWLLEVNTMPGFTAHSLVPQAAAAVGIGLGELCRTLCERAAAEHSSPGGRPAES
ncbi:MAG: D-alanine--D-alanine ligase [Planctomycetota bacterium]